MRALISCLACLCCWQTFAVAKPGSSRLPQKQGYVPRNGFVPDAKTAIRIALAVWLPIYGEQVRTEKPFKATLKNGIWTVTGSLPRGYDGGVAIARIAKMDGHILLVIHGK